MSRSIRRVRRNLPAYDEPYYQIEADYDYPRRAVRQYRPAPEVLNPTLQQRVASLEADVADIAADLMDTDRRLTQLEYAGPYGMPPPYGIPPYGAPPCGVPMPCSVPMPYGMPCGGMPGPMPCGGGCGMPPPPQKHHHNDSDDECSCKKKG